jgi:DNA-binding PadR family transcriptional regulator
MYGRHHGHHGNGHHPGCGRHRRGHLRTWVYSILQQAPKNGAEIVAEIETISQGTWRPSPGSIYPLLDALCQEESIAKREDGRYEITEKGMQEFQWPYGISTSQLRSTDGTIEEMEDYLSYFEGLKQADPAKITVNLDKLKTIRDRLSALIDSP